MLSCRHVSVRKVLRRARETRARLAIALNSICKIYYSLPKIRKIPLSKAYRFGYTFAMTYRLESAVDKARRNGLITQAEAEYAREELYNERQNAK